MERARHFLAKSSSNLLVTSKRELPTSADAYELLEEAGRGVSATVWRAFCKPLHEYVAVKLLDLENLNCSLEEIVREAQTMRSMQHPNVLPLYSSFVHQQNLWMVMPYVEHGSLLNIMKYGYSEGLEEPVIATILKEVLKGMDYMHRHGAIHRDVKAGNILIEKDGQVVLADFGVAATMERGGSWGNQQMARNTFVGTPCWMAPEVMEQTQGYNALADIWSFGITILELAHGHAPFAKLPPMKVLLMTIQNPPPTLESDSGKKHFSKAMRDIVGKCLVKDPSKRPSAAQLLEHKFFKTAHDSGYLVKHLLANLPPVVERVRRMRGGSCEDNQAKMMQSQEAYIRGVSGWNFDVAALKRSAALNGEDTPGGALTPIAEAPSGVLASQSSTSAQPSSPFSHHLAQNGDVPGSARGSQETPRLQGAPSQAQSGALPTLQSSGPSGPPNLVTMSGPAGGPGASPKPPLPAAQASGLLASQRTHSADRINSAAAGTPGKDKGSRPVQVKPGHKKQGRFEVYEGDAPPPISPADQVGAALMEANLAGSKPTTPEHGSSRLVVHPIDVDQPAMGQTLQAPTRTSSEAVQQQQPDSARSQLAAGESDRAKRKGRFQIVEDEMAGEGGKRGVGRSASVSGDIGHSKSGTQTPTTASVGALLPPLKQVLEGMAGQYETMKEIVAAVQDTERGRTASLHALLQEVQERRQQQQRPSDEEVHRLKLEAAQLRQENALLRDRVARLEELSQGSHSQHRLL